MNFETTARSETFDCEALVSASLVEKLVQAVDFPATVEIIPENSQPEEAAAVLACEPSSQADTDPQTQEQGPGDGGIEGLIDDVVSPSSKTPSAPPKPDRWRKVTIKSLQIKVMQAPAIRLALPVIADNITLKITAKAKLSLRLWGKWRSISVTVRDAEISNQQARLQLSFAEGKLRVLPQFDTLQMQLPLRLLKWKFTYNVDLAQPVNRHLAANDFATELPPVFFGVPITGLGGLQLALADLQFKTHPEGLMLCSNFEIERVIDTE